MSEIKFLPGQEPESLRIKLDRFFAKVDGAYPDKVISGFYKNHKKLGEQMTALRRELGYEDNTAFWEAYGYKVDVTVQGATAPKTAEDYQWVLDELKKRYPDGFSYPSISKLKELNPDLSSSIKTLENRSTKMFGVSFRDKLIAEGIMQIIERKSAEEQYEETLQALRDRYSNSAEKPSSISELKAKNTDLSIGIGLSLYIKRIAGKPANIYYAEQGILSPIPEDKPKIKKEPKSISVSRFLANIDIDGYKGKKFYIEMPESHSAIVLIIKEFGGQITNRFTEDTDFLITCKSVYQRECSKIDNVTKLFIERSERNDSKFLISYKTVLEQGRAYYEEKNKAFQLTDFEGKGVLLCIDYERQKTEIRAILKRYNVSFKRAMSKNVDYVIADYNFVNSNNEDNMNIVEEVQKSDNKKLISAKIIETANDEYIENRFTSLSLQEKTAYALDLYKACVDKVETMMENTKTYNDPICSSSIIRAVARKGTNLSDAHDFFDKAAEYNKSWGGRFKEISECYKDYYEKVFKDHGLDVYEIIGIECPIAIAVATFVFGNPDCDIDVEWVRDKWELRGDYSSSFDVGFTLSKAFADGRVLR